MKKKVTNSDLLRLHEETGLSMVQLKRDLGIVDIKKVLQDAKEAYEKSKLSEKQKTLKEWDLLAMKFIKKSLNLEEVSFIWSDDLINSDADSDPWHYVQERYNCFGIKLIKSAKTMVAFKAIWINFTATPEMKEACIKKWDRITYADLRIADTAEKTAEVLNNAYHLSKAHAATLKKLNSQVSVLIKNATTQDQMQQALNFIKLEPKLEKRAITKFLTFITEFYEAKKAFNSLRRISEKGRGIILQRCLELGSVYELADLYDALDFRDNTLQYANTVAERIDILALEEAAKLEKGDDLFYARSLYFKFNKYSEITKEVLIAKWDELALKKANSIKNPLEFKHAEVIFRDGSLARKVALEKLLSLPKEAAV
jgi:hypothetical protein